MGFSGCVIMEKIKNYHTHTLFCGHGKGYPIDYAKIALENNFETLGFSEHAPIDIPGFYFTIKNNEEKYFCSYCMCSAGILDAAYRCRMRKR